MNYRREIDGLRAVAVVPVILFHAGMTIFSGGYVGVDVFFVISGYLITSIIIGELGQGRFSILRFYERRARRILPALFFVMLCCLPFAWVWMLPSQFKEFSQSLIAVSLFVSNILFWKQSGYFAADSDEKPLLHTWSLAVEEQYYMLFPIFLILTWRFGRNPVFYMIVAVSVVSLLLSEWGSRSSPSATFYLAITRAWELLAGSICAFLQYGKPQKSSNALSALGLGLIVMAIFFYDKNTPFPSFYALAPVGGTALIILYGAQGTWAAKLLSLRGFVGIGLISYSAYLWHQPLFAFARLRSLYTPEPWLMGLLALASLGLAYFSWRFIERPFRQRTQAPWQSQKAIFAMSGAVGACFIAFGLYGHLGNGLLSRFAEDKRAFIGHFENSYPERAYFQKEQIYTRFRDECNFFNTEKFRIGQATRAPRESIAQSCFVRDDSQHRAVMIWGDSHAQMLNHGLQTTLPQDWQILQIASSGCKAQLVAEENKADYCDYANWFALGAIQKAQPDVVVIGQVRDHDVAQMQAIAEKLRSLGVARVVFTGPAPHWQHDLPNLIVQKLWHETPKATYAGIDPKIRAQDDSLSRRFEQTPEVRLVSIFDVFCGDTGCMTYVGDDRQAGITSWDYGHLTPAASTFFARNALAEAVLQGTPEATN